MYRGLTRQDTSGGFQQRAVKGAQPKTLTQVKETPGLDGWQIHRSLNPGAENAPDERLANLDDSTSAWIKASVREDGSFTVANGRTGYSKRYKR